MSKLDAHDNVSRTFEGLAMRLGGVIDIASGLVFLGLVAGGWWFTHRSDPLSQMGRRRISFWLVYCLGVSLTIGITQRTSLFPFIGWTLLGPIAPAEYQIHRIYGVDAEGGEHPVDYRAWQPLSWWELPIYLNEQFTRLDPPGQDRVGAYLLERAEGARASAARGQRIGTYERRLGALSMPLFITTARIWARPENVPNSSFVAIRVYLDRWNIIERRGDPTAFSRELIYEHRER